MIWRWEEQSARFAITRCVTFTLSRMTENKWSLNFGTLNVKLCNLSLRKKLICLFFFGIFWAHPYFFLNFIFLQNAIIFVFQSSWKLTWVSILSLGRFSSIIKPKMLYKDRLYLSLWFLFIWFLSILSVRIRWWLFMPTASLPGFKEYKI